MKKQNLSKNLKKTIFVMAILAGSASVFAQTNSTSTTSGAVIAPSTYYRITGGVGTGATGNPSFILLDPAVSTTGGGITIGAGAGTMGYNQGGSIILRAGAGSVGGNIILDPTERGNIKLGLINVNSTGNVTGIATLSTNGTTTLGGLTIMNLGATVNGGDLNVLTNNINAKAVKTPKISAVDGDASPASIQFEKGTSTKGGSIKITSGYTSTMAYGDIILNSSYYGNPQGKIVLNDNVSINGSGKLTAMVGQFMGVFISQGRAQTNTSYLLDVAGKMRADEIVVNSTGADFVFADDYKLPSLAEVEKYIKENGFLPEIPSAATMQEVGMSVGEMQTKLLQKIEELTLYTIELNKEIELLKSKNEL